MKSYKNILFQFLAGLLLMLGIKQFFIFIELDLLDLIASMGKETFSYYADKTDKFGISNKLQRLVHAKIILGFIGIAINYFILFFIAYKKRLNWNISIGITIILCFIHFFKLFELAPISFMQMNLILAYLIPAFLTIIISVVFYLMSFKTTSK